MRTNPWCAALLAPVLCFGAAAQDNFQFTDFSDVSALTLNGSAAQSGSATLRLVNSSASQTASAWHTLPVSVACGFETTFEYTVGGGGSPRAEGFAFVIQGSAAGASAIGGDLWGLGYGLGASGVGIDNCLAIEFDLVQQGFLSDRSDNEISIHTQGVLPNTPNEGASIGRSSPGFGLDAVPRTVRVSYVPGRIRVYVDDLDGNPRIDRPFRFENGGSYLAGGGPGGMQLANGTAWVGFTASTGLGSATKRVDIDAWSWQSLTGPAACYDGTEGVDLLRIDGAVGGFFRQVSVIAGDPFTIDIDAPHGVASAPYLLFAELGVADGSNAVVFPVGTLCFPATGRVPLATGPAPAQFQAPAGVVVDLTLTLQAIIANDAQNPHSLGITNAIVLDFEPGPSPSITDVRPSTGAPGTRVVVDGSAFSTAVQVDIDGTPLSLTSVTASRLEFDWPVGVACDAVLTARNPDGQTATAAINPIPVGTTITNTGPAVGGTVITIIGSGLAAGSTVTVGGVAANVLAASGVAVSFFTPPGTPGPASIVVTTPGGCTLTLPFTYL